MRTAHRQPRYVVGAVQENIPLLLRFLFLQCLSLRQLHNYPSRIMLSRGRAPGSRSLPWLQQTYPAGAEYDRES